MLTDLQIQRLQPAPKRRVVAVGDGLSIRVEPSGRKNWISRRAGRTRGLGTYPDISLADARAMICDVPTTFGDVWHLWFDEVVAPAHKRPENALSLKPIWKPIMGQRVGNLKRAELVAMLRALRDRAPGRSLRALSQLRGVLDYAVGLGLLEISPIYGVPRKVMAGKVNKRTRVLSDDEIAALKAFAERDDLTGAHARFSLFCLATCCRRGEAGLARRSRIADRWLSFPASAMKSGRPWEVYLSDFALSQVTTSNGDPLFQTDPKSTQQFLNRNLRVGWTLHDLRRTAASRMAQSGVPLHAVSACLAHAIGTQADQHYLHGALYRDERQAALEAWGEWLSD